MECIGIQASSKSNVQIWKTKVSWCSLSQTRPYGQDDQPRWMHSENIWFKWSENGKWKTSDLVGPGDPGGPGVPGGSGDPDGPSSLSGPGDSGDPGGQCSQDDRPRWCALRKYMVFMVETIKLLRKVGMLRLWRTNGGGGANGKWKIEQCSGRPATAIDYF